MEASRQPSDLDTACAHTHPRPMVSPLALEQAAALFSTLGDPERLRLLQLLAAGESCVTELVASTGAEFSTVSQRLRVLRSQGLIARRREGKHIYYTLADCHVDQLVHNALSHVNEGKA